MKQLLYFTLLLYISFTQAQITDFKTIDLKRADKLALKYQGEDLSNLPRLSYNLTHGLTTDVEKFRAIYKWVCTNIENDFDLSDLNESQRYRFKNDSLKLRHWNNQMNTKLFKTLSKNKSTVCTGYAYLIKELCLLANLKCVIVNGYGKLSSTDITNFNSPNHSWNAVLLNNKWYLVDATWSSGKQNEETLDFEFDYSDGYFLTHPKLFAVNHYPLNKKWLLLGQETYTFNRFLNAPIIYKNGFNSLNEHQYPKQLHTNIKTQNSTSLQYVFKQPIAKKDISVVIDNGYNYKKIKTKITTGYNNHLKVDFKFDTKGFYDVHLKYKNKYLATYTYNVVDY